MPPAAKGPDEGQHLRESWLNAGNGPPHTDKESPSLTLHGNGEPSPCWLTGHRQPSRAALARRGTAAPAPGDVLCLGPGPVQSLGKRGGRLRRQVVGGGGGAEPEWDYMSQPWSGKCQRNPPQEHRTSKRGTAQKWEASEMEIESNMPGRNASKRHGDYLKTPYERLTLNLYQK
ncbi:unnamed protein product [Natator depressus]